MIYAIVLSYTRPQAEVAEHLDGHKKWLVDNVQNGHVIAAGPLDSGTGGLVLATGAKRETIEAMMQQDPFIAQGVARYDVHACAPGLASTAFPSQWAPDAKFI